MKVLIVDNEPKFMEPYLTELAFREIHTVLLENVKDACDYFDKNYNEIDCVIMDLMMPGDGLFSENDTEGGLITGHLVVKRMQSAEPKMPIILLTNKPKSIDIKGAVSGGTIRYMYKPDTLPFELADAVQAETEQFSRRRTF